MTTRNLVLSLVLFMVLLLFAMIVGEVGLRFLGYAGAPESLIENIRHVDDPILNWRFVPNSTVQDGNVISHYNSAGFRDVEHAVEKPAHVTRVVVVGDRGLLGEGAPLSARSIARLKAKWAGEFGAWNQRSLEELEVVYLWVDGVYVKAGLEKEKAALLVVVAGLSDGRKVFLAITPGYRESTESWSAVLRDLKKRGLGAPRLVLGDGHPGIWSGLAEVYPEAEEQRCWNHRILNVLDKLPKKRQAEAKALLCQIPYAPTLKEAEKAKEAFQRWCRSQGFHPAAEILDHDWERMVSFYRYPKEHWVHLRTTNPIESPFAAVRLRTDAAKRSKKWITLQPLYGNHDGRRNHLPPPQCSRPVERRLPEGDIRRWNTATRGLYEGRRLSYLHTPVDGSSEPTIIYSI